MDKYIGFDVDHKNTVACIVENDKKDRYIQLKTDIDQMKDLLLKERNDGQKLHLTFEVGGLAGFMYDNLVDHVDELKVSNPSKMTWIYRTEKKTDRIDARKQAVLHRMGELPVVHMPDRDVRQWRQTIQHRRKLIDNRTQAKNRIRALLKGQGFLRPECKGGWWKSSNLLWMRAETCNAMEMWRIMLSDLLDNLELLQKQIVNVTKMLAGYLQKYPAAVLLQTIPGIGPRTAEAVLAYAGDIKRFKRGKHFGAYFGLVPCLDESGSKRKVGHITKHGPSVVRWLIVESAWRAIRYSPELKNLYQRIQHGQTGRKKIAIVAVARKILQIMLAMLRTGELFNEKLVSTQEYLN